MANQLDIRLASNVSVTEGDDNISLTSGELGDTTLHLLGGNDVLNGSTDSEKINGNQDSDNVFGGGGADTINGGKDNDDLEGEDGNDVLFGDRGSDILNGGNGEDRINGGKDDDNIFGGAGNDMLSGDLGSDTLTGGDGNDVFMLRNNGLGTDFITDFQPGSDRLQLPDVLNPNNVEITVQDGNSVVSLNGENLAIIDGISTISTDDFVGGSSSPNPSPNPSTSESDTFDAELLERTNAERNLAGLPPLRFSESLDEAADLHAIDMAEQNYFSHTGMDGSSPGQRAQRVGYGSRFVGENIAINTSPSNVMTAWMNSSGHRANILNPNYQEIGFGYSPNSDSSQGLFVQVFGNDSF